MQTTLTPQINPEDVIKKCKANEDLTYEEYCVGCNRTLSEKFFDRYEIDLALRVMEEFIIAGNRLDELKKALFYGKNLEAVAQKHKAELNYEGHYFGLPWANKVDPKVIHAILGMATEDVELVENLYKAINNYEELDAVNVMEELGDHAFYQSIIFHTAKLKHDIVPTLQKMWRTTLLKLDLRYQGQFSSEKAINRDLEAERALLEQHLTTTN